MGGRAISLLSLSNLSLEMFLEIVIHISMPMWIVHMIDEYRVGDIIFRNLYFWNERKKTVIDFLRMWKSFLEANKDDTKYTQNLRIYLWVDPW